MEDFSLPTSPTRVDFNEGGILDDNMPCVFGFVPYTFEPTSTVSGAGGDVELQGALSLRGICHVCMVD